MEHWAKYAFSYTSKSGEKRLGAVWAYNETNATSKIDAHMANSGGTYVAGTRRKVPTDHPSKLMTVDQS